MNSGVEFLMGNTCPHLHKLTIGCEYIYGFDEVTVVGVSYIIEAGLPQLN